MSKNILFLFFFFSSLAFADLPEIPANYIFFQKAEGGYELFIKKIEGIGSIILTESQRDPSFKKTTYGLRSTNPNSINGHERRILDGKQVVFNDNTCYLIDSTTEYLEGIGEFFRFYLTEEVVYGYPWARSGKLKIAPGLQINLRLFAKKYGDYSGPFRDQWIILKIEPLPVTEEETNIAMKLAKSDSTIILLHSSEGEINSSPEASNIEITVELIKQINQHDKSIYNLEGLNKTASVTKADLKLVIISKTTSFPNFKLTGKDYQSNTKLRIDEKIAIQKTVLDQTEKEYWIYCLDHQKNIISITIYKDNFVLNRHYKINYLSDSKIQIEKYDSNGKKLN